MSLRPDLQISAATAQAIIDDTLPGHTVGAITTVHGGQIAAVLEISFVDHEPPVILKVYPDFLHWKMHKEVTVLSLIRNRLSLAVPHILFTDDSKKRLALNFTLMTKLDGELLGPLERSLPPDQFTAAYRQIGKLLREFHFIEMEAFGYIGATGIITPQATNHGYVAAQFDRKLSEFAERGGSARLSQQIADYAADRSHLLHGCTQAVLCHNDLHAGNLLAKFASGNLQLCGVLDFENALAGDPLKDVAKACYYLTEDARLAVLEGYGEIDRPHWQETLRLYHLLFVLELWCWKAQTGEQRPLDQLAQELKRFSEN